MNEINYLPIGIIHSPFKEIKGMPIQPTGAEGIEGLVEVFADYSTGLKDIDGFSHIILLYHFHLSEGYSLETKPFLDEVSRGLFATRSPARPNPVGISVVRLIGVKGSTLHVEGIDILDGTPLLDIKPYVPDFDQRSGEQTGWLSGELHNVRRKRADRRFAPGDNTGTA